MLKRGSPIRCWGACSSIFSYSRPFIRHYANDANAKKKKTPSIDISQIPLKHIGVVADLYIPPKYSQSPIRTWPRLFARRVGLFAVNTYSVVKFKRETSLKLKFNDWKEHAMEQYVALSKIFALSCAIPREKREEYLRSRLEGIAGNEALRSIIRRAWNFPANTSLSWELVAVEKDPKVVCFNSLPDSNNITALVQFVLKVKTKERFSVSKVDENKKESERSSEHNLVYSLNPFTNELLLVGSLFDADYNRGLLPQVDFTNPQALLRFQQATADVFRSEKLSAE